MDQTRLHLFITHLPVFGAGMGLIVLLLGLRWRNSQTILASYFLLLITALAALLAYFTGEAAEEAVEHLPGFSHDAIEEHEDAGKIALYSFILLGVIAVAGIFFRTKTWARRIPVVLVIVSLAGFGIALRTASLGGAIRHTELQNPAVQEAVPDQDLEPADLSEVAEPPVQPDRNGEKWQANPETTEAIDNMRKKFSALPPEPDREQLLGLHASLEHEFSELVRQCTMTGEAHDQLHNYILPLREHIARLGQEPSQAATEQIGIYLGYYERYFR